LVTSIIEKSERESLGKMIELKSEYFSFVVHKARGRWTSVFRSFLIMATSGAIYLFPIYSNNIKRNLGYN